MTIDIANLARALRDAIEVDEFIISESRSYVATETVGEGAMRGQLHPHELEVQVFVDRRRGRGVANFSPAADRDLKAQIQKASTRAHSALGPSWRLPPPAAPARVSVFEPSDHSTNHEIARFVLGAVEASLPQGMRALGTSVRVVHGEHRSILSTGFDNHYPSLNVSIDALVQAEGGLPVPLHLQTRRLSRLADELEETSQRCQRRSLLDARAEPVSPGLVDIAFLQSAYVPREESDFGLWTPLILAATASRVRTGISTFKPGRPLLPRAPRGETLSIRSEGTEPLALRSAPFSRDGQAVRNFPLVEEGIIAGVAVDHREAALGGVPANGGVRRLVVSSGPRSAEELMRPETRPLLVIRACDGIRATTRGSLHMSIASAELRRRDPLGVVTSSPVRSAIACGKLLDWLGDAYASRERRDDSWLAGPRVLRFDGVHIA